MEDTRFDVAGIGNAIVDVLASTDDAFLEAQGLVKGSMTLIDEARAEALYAAMGPAVESSGGSCANTMAGLASLGGAGVYIGKVRKDTLGDIFRHDIRAGGITFDTPPLETGPATARCFVLITPDAERTMATYLGACTCLEPADIDQARISSAAITYVEGYLWDMPAAKDAIRRAAVAARAAGRKFAFSLSDSFCVDRHRQEFVDLLKNHVDILFANTPELLSLTERDTVDAASGVLRGLCPTAFVTRGGDGCRVLAADRVEDVPAHPVETPVDMTGAGDQFAAGVMWGLCRGYAPVDSARIGAVCAAEVISHIGARPAVDSLATLVADTLGLNGKSL